MTSDDHRRTAARWRWDRSSALHAYASTGAVVAGIAGEIEDRLAFVERAVVDIGFDRIGEHERLRALLNHVEPILAVQRASEAGRQYGQFGASAWREDALDGRPSVDAGAEARRVLDGFEAGDPAILELAPGPDEVPDLVEIATRCGWLEPDIDDAAAHDRWEAALVDICDAYVTAFVNTFWAEVTEACRRQLAETTTEPEHPRQNGNVTTEPRPVTDLGPRHLANVRYHGAVEAYEAAAGAGLVMSRADAEAVVAGAEQRFRLPAFSGPGASPSLVLSTDELVEPLDVGVHGASVETLLAMQAEAKRAWEDGRDAIWPTALRASALGVLGRLDEERAIDRVNRHRLSAFADAVRLPGDAWPYIRRVVPPAAAVAGSRGQDTPSGWVAQPIGRWEGADSEVVFDPRRFEIVDLGDSARRPPPGAIGWRMFTSSGTRALWITDRIATAHLVLDRFEQAAGLDSTGPDFPEPPAPGIEL